MAKATMMIGGCEVTELTVALCHERYKRDRAWADFVARVDALRSWDEMRQASGSFESGIGVVNGRPVQYWRLDDCILLRGTIERETWFQRLTRFFRVRARALGDVKDG